MFRNLCQLAADTSLMLQRQQLFVFQRTPSSIDVRNNRPTDPEWAKSLEPGWQQYRMDNFNVLVSGGWTMQFEMDPDFDYEPQADASIAARAAAAQP